MNTGKEKLQKCILGWATGLGCLACAGLLFAAPLKVQAVPLGSQPAGTPAPSNEGDAQLEGGAENQDANAAQDGEAGAEVGAEAPQGGEEGAAAAGEAVVTSVTVTEARVNVRSDASTSASIAGKATSGMELPVTGQKEDSSGTTWYAVTFESDGNTVSGYIRSDMVEAHETVPTPAEPEPAPEEVPAEPVPEQQPVVADYYVQFEDDGTGTGVNAWFLHDNIMGNKYKLDELLTGAAGGGEEESGDSTMRIIVFVMAAVIVVLIIILTVLILKLRGTGDDDYDDDDEDDEDDEDDDDEEEMPRRRRFGRLGSRRDRDDEDEDDEDDEDEEDDEEEYRPVRKAPVRERTSGRARRVEEEDDDDEEEEEYRPRRSTKGSGSKKDKNWQSKNFLDDDDLEFEFLDLK